MLRDSELFTELTGGRDPLHYDEDADARSRFRGIVAMLRLRASPAAALVAGGRG